MSRLQPFCAAAFIIALACPALAFADGTPQNHHCKLPDGSMDMKKTHKECSAAKGTWAKDAPAAKAPAAKDAPAKGSAAPAPAPKK